MKIVVLCIIVSFVSASCVERVKIDDGEVVYVYLKEEVEDSISIYNYFMGGVFQKALISKRYNGNVKEVYQYYKSGSISAYRVYLESKLVYYRLYDIDGTSKKYNGVGLLYTDSTMTSVSVNVHKNETYKLTHFMVNPPNTEVAIFTGKCIGNESNRDFDVHPVYYRPLTDSKWSHKIRYENTGEDCYIIYWFVKDTISGDVQEGRLAQKINIIP